MAYDTLTLGKPMFSPVLFPFPKPAESQAYP